VTVTYLTPPGGGTTAGSNAPGAFLVGVFFSNFMIVDVTGPYILEKGLIEPGISLRHLQRARQYGKN